MSASAPYEPKYTTVENVPLGSYDRPEDEVREALARAESRLEDEVNDGVELPETRRTKTAADAVENLATHRLLRPATGPAEAHYGDVAEYGDDQFEYLETYKQEYREARDALITVGEQEGDEAGGEPGGGFDPAFEFEAF